MSFFRKLFENVKKDGISQKQFYFGLIFLLLLPILGKWETIVSGELVTVQSIGVVNKERYKSWSFAMQKKYTKWQYTSENGQKYTFEGVRNEIHRRGKKAFAFFNPKSPESSFIISFMGITADTNGMITLWLIIIWISLFFVHGQSDYEKAQLLLLREWRDKALALVSIIFVLTFLTAVPIWLVIEFGWQSLIMFAIIILVISPQIKNTLEYLIFSEAELKQKEVHKRKKKRKEALELMIELRRRKALKEKNYKGNLDS